MNLQVGAWGNFALVVGGASFALSEESRGARNSTRVWPAEARSAGCPAIRWALRETATNSRPVKPDLPISRAANRPRADTPIWFSTQALDRTRRGSISDSRSTQTSGVRTGDLFGVEKCSSAASSRGSMSAVISNTRSMTAQEAGRADGTDRQTRRSDVKRSPRPPPCPIRREMEPC